MYVCTPLTVGLIVYVGNNCYVQHHKFALACDVIDNTAAAVVAFAIAIAIVAGLYLTMECQTCSLAHCDTVAGNC